MRRALLVAAVLLCVALGGCGASHPHYTVELDNAFGLTIGSNVTVAGVKAGQITSFSVTNRLPPKALVTVELTQPGLDRLHSDAQCQVRQQSLIGEYYVDCDPGTSSRLLPAGGTLPVAQTASTVPPDLVDAVLRLPYRQRLAIIIDELGTGLAGRSQDLQEVIHRAVPGLRETTEVLDTLARQRRVIEGFIGDSDVVLGRLAAQRRQVSRWVATAGRTAAISATRAPDIQAGFQRLPAFLDQLRPTMAELGRFSDREIPLLQSLQAGAPRLNDFLSQLGPFSQESLPSLRALANASKIGRTAFNDSSRDIAELRLIANDAPGAAKPLRQFLQTLDTRSRATVADPRAAVTAPPSPDPTANASGKGFTGFESIWNYIFWQTLSTNGFDQISHYLRGGLLRDQDCSPYTTDPTPAVFAKCGIALGPSHPGILGQPDPTPPYPGVNRGGAPTATAASASAPADATGTPSAATPAFPAASPTGAPAAAQASSPATAAPAQPGAQAQITSLLNYLLK